MSKNHVGICDDSNTEREKKPESKREMHVKFIKFLIHKRVVASSANTPTHQQPKSVCKLKANGKFIHFQARNPYLCFRKTDDTYHCRCSISVVYCQLETIEASTAFLSVAVAADGDGDAVASEFA